MTISAITKKVETLASNWEDFKKVNEQRLAEIKKNGTPDSLTIQNLNKLNSSLTNISSRISAIEAANARNDNSNALETKSLSFAGQAASSDAQELVREHKSAFNAYVRRGVEGELNSLETKALSAGSDTDGGYLITSDMADEIVEKVADASAMRSLAFVQEISTDALELIEETGNASASWTTETGAVSDSTTPTIAKKSIPVHEIFAQPKATQKLIDDASVDIEFWLAGKLAEGFASLEGTAFISGSGTGQPKGILSYADGVTNTTIEQIASGTSAVVEADSLIKLVYSLKS